MAQSDGDVNDIVAQFEMIGKFMESLERSVDALNESIDMAQNALYELKSKQDVAGTRDEIIGKPSFSLVAYLLIMNI